jgi:hypothetical protein
MVYMDHNQLMTVTLTYDEWISVRDILRIANELAMCHDVVQLRQAIADQNNSQFVP